MLARKLFKSISNLSKTSLSAKKSLYFIPKWVYLLRKTLDHIKDMNTEHIKYKLQKDYDELEVIEKTDRIYKPTYTIEFNREGEVLLYSCEPIQNAKYYKSVHCLFPIPLYPIRIFNSCFYLDVLVQSM